ncbi:MAG TPA: DivIVA domain-containing protein [Acidimicrobiales bacterium]
MTNVEFTSDAVRSAKFRERRKGYHPEEVDAFLERAAIAIDQLTSRLAETTARALKAEAALAGNSEADESVRRTLVLAQRTAEMAVREANEEAGRIRAEAAGEAERIRSDATADAQKRQQEAEDRAASLESDAERTWAAAVQHATATVDEADASAQATVRDAEERAAAIRSEAEEEVASLRATAAAEIEAQAVEARREVEAAVAALRTQEDQLRADVSQLAGYLANERARVLGALTTALEDFGTTLVPAPGGPAELAFVARSAADEANGAPVAEPESVESMAEADEAVGALSTEAESVESVESVESGESGDAVEAGEAVEAVAGFEAGQAGEAGEAVEAVAGTEAEAGLGADAEPGGTEIRPLEVVDGGVAVDAVAPVDAVEPPAVDAGDGEAATQPGEPPEPDAAADEAQADEPALVAAHEPGAAGEGANGEPTWWSWDEAVRAPAPVREEVPWARSPEPADDPGAQEAPDVAAVAVDDEPPARLLFTLEDENRRAAEHEHPEPPMDTKPRKTLLGRRRG